MGLRCLLASLAIAAFQCCEAAPDGLFRLVFTTDEQAGGGATYRSPTFGPDGPWQPVAVKLGNNTRGGAPEVPVWPTTNNITYLLSTEGGGVYSDVNAEEIAPMEFGSDWYDSYSDTTGYFSNYTIPDDVPITDLNPMGRELIFAKRDSILLNHKTAAEYFTTKVGMYSFPKWYYHPLNGRNYSAPVGQFGMRNALMALAATGYAASESFGLHIGSVPLGQPGSLVMGGYERNRVLAPLGTFSIVAYTHAMFLMDVILSHEEGFSPFPDPQPGSIYRGVPQANTRAMNLTKQFGGKAGSVMVSPDPAAPGIYLPPGTCEAAAEHLPVYFDPISGHYLWNVSSPWYEHIVNSPAYLGFVISDRTATNVTIKVPMKLLNLTLESPIVDTPTPYFPCHSRDSKLGSWNLGRAFLQATFFGANLGRNVSFLAQAPGPDMEQSVTEMIMPDEVSIKAREKDGFAKSWRGTWRVLKEGEVPEGVGVVAVGPGGEKGLKTGEIVGIVIGVVGGVALVAGAVWFWRRRKGKDEASASELGEGESRGELDGGKAAHEMGDTVVVEVGGEEKKVFELGETQVFEMPAEPCSPRTYEVSPLTETASPVMSERTLVGGDQNDNRRDGNMDTKPA
ncbi:hypothetical protein OQA88_5334 [Cercophora sp. LCS_1]